MKKLGLILNFFLLVITAESSGQSSEKCSIAYQKNVGGIDSNRLLFSDVSSTGYYRYTNEDSSLVTLNDYCSIANIKKSDVEPFTIGFTKMEEGKFYFWDMYQNYRRKHSPFSQREFIAACSQKASHLTQNQCTTLFFIKEEGNIYAVTLDYESGLRVNITPIKYKELNIISGGDCVNAEIAYPLRN